MMNNQFDLTIEPRSLSWHDSSGRPWSVYRSDELVNASWAFADGVKIKLREQPRHKTTYSPYGRGRPDHESIREDKKARVYVSVSDTFNLAEDLTNRTRRPYEAWRAPVTEALARIGLHPTKLSWSQKAGCSMCPCSPGFILEGVPDAARFDIWVRLPGAPTVDETKPARELVFN